MRFSEFNGKEVIDVNSGERIGIIGHSDLVIDPKSGEIEAIILPRGNFLSFGKQQDEIHISWNSIRKIGPDMIIVERVGRAKAY